MPRTISVILTILVLSETAVESADRQKDSVAELQRSAISDDRAEFGHWGTDPQKYTQWTSHSNRLIPVYTFGTGNAEGAARLDHYTGTNSPYRSEDAVRRFYGRVPERTVHEDAVWLDQTNIADLQRAAAAAGRRYIFLVVFDGMDWDTTRAAAIYNEGDVTYSDGRGTGTHFQSYDAGGTSEFGFMVTSPHNEGTDVNVDSQTLDNPGGNIPGGYDPDAAGYAPWDMPKDPGYLIAKPTEGSVRHAYTDSASSAVSMTTGIKTYNNAINVGPSGELVSTIAHELQENGWAVGAVSSVPICHATPAAAYAHNVSRNDYQDISRDMLGLPSIAHPDRPLPGMDVVIGSGFGTRGETGKRQGENYEPGNIYLADSDLQKVDSENGGRYVTAVRTKKQSGSRLLADAAHRAVQNNQRLLGFFGMGEYNGHLPFQTANGDFSPVPGNRKRAEEYSQDDVLENPTLAEMTTAAIDVLSAKDRPFWLMVEAGDVDWANHDNNLDNSIGAVNSGDAAVKVITDWVEQNSNWNESLLIVTADHGHMLTLTAPQKLVQNARGAPNAAVSSLPRIRVSDEGSHFVAGDAEEPFVVWGVNYDHDSSGRLLDEYWIDEWPMVVEDFQEIKALGANCVRIHLQLGKFMETPETPDKKSLQQLGKLVRLAERTGLYLDLTGLACYHKKNIPVWYDELGESERWAVQAAFWEAVASACAGSPAVFCYDLMNEPVLPGADKPNSEWLAGELGGKFFVQRITLDLGDRTREQVAEQWVTTLVDAIRVHDSRTMITVGAIPWVYTFGGGTPLFYSPAVGRHLDFVAVHFYPESGKVDAAIQALHAYDIGKPILIEEMFPLKCSQEEMAEFVRRSAEITDGWVSFYWGTTAEELRIAKEQSFGSAILASWLATFEELSATVKSGDLNVRHNLPD